MGKGMQRYGAYRSQYEQHKKKIIQSSDICGICGKPVDKKLKYPHPMSATVDHIIPLSKGGDPTSFDNLQLAHFKCNRAKSNTLGIEMVSDKKEMDANVGIRNLPLIIDWKNYSPSHH